MQKKKRGRPSKEDQKRQDVLIRLQPLTDKWIKFIQSSQEAQRPCDYCAYMLVNNVKTLVPTVKQDADGNCIKCHGKLLVPDVPRQEWAAEQLGDRLAPKPKAQEIKIKDDADTTEFERELEGADSKIIDKLAKELAITFGTDSATAD